MLDLIKAIEKMAEQGSVQVHVVNMGAKPTGAALQQATTKRKG